MQKKLVINFVYQAAYQILLVILPIITIPIVSGALGPEGLGVFNFVNSIVAYFILVAGLGMANYGVREISLVRHDRKQLSKKFWELQIFNSCFSLSTLLVYIAFSFFAENTIYYLVGGISVFSCLFDITWFFSGIEEFKKITIRNFIVKLLSFVLIVLFIKEPSDLFLYFVITFGSVFVSQISMWLAINKYVDWEPVTVKAVFAHLRPALEFFIAKIAVTIYQNTTKTILGLMTTMTAVGYYSNAMSLVLVSGNIINAMNTIMIPRMSNMYGNNNERGMIQLLKKTIHLQLYFTIAIMFGIVAVSDKLVGWFFGSEFFVLKYVIPCVAPVVIFQSLQQAVALQYLIPKNNLKEYNVSVILGAIITVALTILLVPFVDLYGAVIGINVGYIVISVLRLKVLISETEFELDYNKIIKFVISGIFMLIVIYLATNRLSSTIFTTLFQVLIGVATYFTLTAVLRVNPLIKILHSKKVK